MVQGEIRPGYKQTEVGVIPEDWDQLEVEDLVSTGVLEKPMDGNHGAIHPKSADFVGYGIPFVMANNLASGRLDIESCVHITRRQADGLQKGFARKGDVLLTHKATIGETAIVGEIPFDYLMLTPQVTYYRVRQDEILDRNYLFQFFRGGIFQTQLQLMSGGGTRSYIGITAQRNLPIVLPKAIEEQRAIAAALADADALIAALEGMIVKKRDLKQAAMQHLLTGNTRLPGFSGEWEVKRLGEIGEVSGAGVDKKIVEGEQPVRLLNYMDAYRRTFIESSDLDHWVTAPPHHLRRCLVQKGDVFFTPSSETRDDIANSAVALEDIPEAAYSYHVTRLRIADAWDIRFRAYAFQSKAFLSQAQTVCDGSGTRYVISLAKFRGLTVQFPEQKEQTAIADVLSDMDTDLAALEAQAAKARSVKQGMMQELLTGRVRLV